MRVQRILSLFLTLIITSCISASALAAGDTELRGQSKSHVESLYGKPNAIIGPVGQPPITKWQYPDITVVFEYDLVIHAYRRDFELEKRPTSTVSQRPDSISGGGDSLEIPQ